MSEDVILEHYRQEAEERGHAPSSTMHDLRTREIEVEGILECLRLVTNGTGSVLEVGCGNGFLLQQIRDRFDGLQLTGGDFSPEMVSLAAARNISVCEVKREDVRRLSFPSGSFDTVVSERCLINILDAQEQSQALHELWRVLRPGGHCVLVEAFTDGAENLNRARVELGLPENRVPFHNRWFDKNVFLGAIDGLFDVVSGEVGGAMVPPANILSSHYFISRVLYPAVTQREVLYNTEFVNFFSFLPPQGNYSPIQLLLLQRRA